MALSWPHIHLMLNHIPVLGTVFGLALLAVSIWQQSEEIKRAALYTFFVTSIFAVTTYLTGEPAEEAVEHIAGVSERLIEAHEDFAMYALIGSVTLGVVSAAAILRNIGGKVGKAETALVLLLSLAVSGAMAWTANLGGQVHHEELRPGYAAPAHHGVMED